MSALSESLDSTQSPQSQFAELLSLLSNSTFQSKMHAAMLLIAAHVFFGADFGITCAKAADISLSCVVVPAVVASVAKLADAGSKL